MSYRESHHCSETFIKEVFLIGKTRPRNRVLGDKHAVSNGTVSSLVDATVFELCSFLA